MSSPRAERRKAARAQRPHAGRRPGERTSVWRTPLPYVVSVVAIVGAIGWSVVSSRAPAAPVPTPGAATAAAVASVTGVPPGVLDAVASGGLADIVRATAAPPLRGPSGKPLVMYLGAEYCPYCASERWSLIVALSRFGTFRDLSLSRSSSTDVFPDTPTFSFRGSTYASDVIEFTSVEMADRRGGPLDSPTPVQQASYARFDPGGSIPFISIADQFVAVGSGYPPDVLKGKTWAEIGAQLTDATSPVARAILGHANQITAAICRTTGDAPASVCASPAVRGIAAPGQ